MATSNLPRQPDTLEALFSDDDRLDYLAQTAVRDALREHKRLGQSVVVWQDGKVVTLTPEDIPVDLTDEAAYQPKAEKTMIELTFRVEDAPDGGYTAHALGQSISTKADTLEELRVNIREAVECHYEEDEAPNIIHLHLPSMSHRLTTAQAEQWRIAQAIEKFMKEHPPK